MKRMETLEPFYQQVKQIILARQHPVTGLLPASTAVTTHGDYTDAWVRDNVYSILAVWGLALAYGKHEDLSGRRFELEHATIKLMRGLLSAMMKQAHKVEAFKYSQSPLDALHAKYDTATGDVVVADDAWGHLQVDATSLYLLMLAQMTTSGLNIVYSYDEVNFIQNLIYYIGRAYRTPDYGIWERGDKTNHGLPELNTSSLAMAKAALEALNNFDVFGAHGSQASKLHTMPDDIARLRVTMQALLPRESRSKEVDAALLSAISFPAFAVDDLDLVTATRTEIVSKLEGKYGLKRFLRDGHQTTIEDVERLHYTPEELQKFEHIESEWPLFFAYLYLDALFQADDAQVRIYRARLARVTVIRDGVKVLPELYVVPAESVLAERAKPGSQTRLANDNVPLVWAQSLYILGQLIDEGHLSPDDIDPLGRHRKVGQRASTAVQVALLAEDEDLQAELEALGVSTETPEQVGIQVRRASEIAAAYEYVGRNSKLDLTGRPKRMLRSLASTRLYRICGEVVVCLPSFYDQQQYYLNLDPEVFVDSLKSELAYIQRHWSSVGRPTLTLLLTNSMMATGGGELLSFIQELRSGICNGVLLKLDSLHLLRQTATFERIDDLHEFSFAGQALQNRRAPQYVLRVDSLACQPLTAEHELALEVEQDTSVLLARLTTSQNLYEHAEVLTNLSQAEDLDTEIRVGSQLISLVRLLEEVHERAGHLRLWAVLRRTAGLLNKTAGGLDDAVTDIVVRQKQLIIGKSYSDDALINQPVSESELLIKLVRFCRKDVRDQVLTQEILVYLASLMKAEPNLFEGILTLRVGYYILLLASEIAQAQGLSQDEAYERLMQLSPSEVRAGLYKVLTDYQQAYAVLRDQEALHATSSRLEFSLEPSLSADDINATSDTPSSTPEVKLDKININVATTTAVSQPPTNWWRWRQLEGTLNRTPEEFYPKLWQLFKHCKGLVIGDKLERRNRLDSSLILSEMTPHERNFALRIEHLLNKIPSPEYRQVSLEALEVLADLAANNPELVVADVLVIDVIVGHAVRLAWLADTQHAAENYEQDKSQAWAGFYERPPEQTRQFLAAAFSYLLASGDAQELLESAT
ncbi:MAG: glycoside hydrolase family 15 protein [Deinococcota bacterium]